jgi:hypothetical protein
MPTLTFSGTLTYGSTTPEGSVPCREPLSLSIEYSEAAMKTVQIAANSTDFPITLDSVDSPTFLFIEALETDVTVKLSDGVVLSPTPTDVTENGGWVMIATPSGQQINQLLVTTPASPATGARIRILAVE